MEIDTCSWKKTAYGYESDCGYLTKNSIRNFAYCPYCGRKFGYDRRKYMRDYCRKYYKEHK